MDRADVSLVEPDVVGMAEPARQVWGNKCDGLQTANRWASSHITLHHCRVCVWNGLRTCVSLSVCVWGVRACVLVCALHNRRQRKGLGTCLCLCGGKCCPWGGESSAPVGAVRHQRSPPRSTSCPFSDDLWPPLADFRSSGLFGTFYLCVCVFLSRSFKHKRIFFFFNFVKT